VAADDTMPAWLTLPRRVYLDTSTLQKLYDFGGVVFEDELFVPAGRAARERGLVDELAALHNIFSVNERAQFEFAVTGASFPGISRDTRSGFSTSSTPG
jgi:hypothetical protein